MSIYEPETQPSAVLRNDTVSLPEMSEYLLAMRHELRAPLNAIIGMSALLLDDDVTPRQAQYVKSVHAAGESLSVILNDVLDLASVAANRLAIEPIPFDLKSMIEETASALTPKANERGLALRVDWRPELPRFLVGDPGRTRQVIGNLVGYAVNGTTHGEVVIRVTPDGERSGVPAIRFAIEDTGIGIAPGRLARIFDEYVPLDASPYRSFGVTGLGLRLSAELVRLMNGVIHAESEPGRGNRLWFSIPMPTAAQYETGLDADAAVTGGGRALIVEADYSNRSRFAQQFQDAGWRVEFTSEIETVSSQLRDALAEGDPYRTCIISHYAVRPIHMEVAREVKADSLLAPVALVMVTAVGSPGDGQKLWNAGFAAYLRKPVPAEEIRESLEALARLGPTGKGNALITRHSLAEIRNAQSFEVEGIDRMLASLTAPGEASVEATDDAVTEATISTDTDAPEATAARLETPREIEQESVTPPNTEATAEPSVAEQANPVTPLPSSLDALLALTLPTAEADTMPTAADAAADAAEAAVADEATTVSDEPGQSLTAEQAGPCDGSAVSEAVEAPRPTEPLLLAPPADQSSSSEPDAQALIGPAVSPTDASPSSPSLFHTEPGTLAPPAIAPAVDAPDAQVEEVSSPQDDAQLALEVAPAQGIDVPAATSDHAEEATPSVSAPVGDTPAQLATSLIDGHQDALWESEPAVAPLDGLVTTQAEANEEPAAVVESVPLALPVEFASAQPEQANARHDAPTDPVEAEAVEVVADAVPATTASDSPEPLESADSGQETATPIAETPLLINHGATEHFESAEAVDTPAFESEAVASTPDHAEQAESIRSEAVPSDPVVPESTTHNHAEAATSEADGASTPVPVPDAPESGPDLDPEPELDLSTFEVVSPQLLDQLSTGGGFFTQHQVTTFLRDAGELVERLAVAQGDELRDSLDQLAHAADWVGAGRLSALVSHAAARRDRTGDIGPAAPLAAALAEARTTLDLASPQGLPAELPAVGATFAEQLSPTEEGSGRMLAVTLATSFAAEAPIRAAELREAVAQGNTDAAQRLAQTLKGMCGLIGAEPLAKLSALVEADARLKRLGQTERYLAHIDHELERVRRFLDQARA